MIKINQILGRILNIKDELIRIRMIEREDQRIEREKQLLELKEQKLRIRNAKISPSKNNL